MPNSQQTSTISNFLVFQKRLQADKPKVANSIGNRRRSSTYETVPQHYGFNGKYQERVYQGNDSVHRSNRTTSSFKAGYCYATHLYSTHNLCTEAGSIVTIESWSIEGRRLECVSMQEIGEEIKTGRRNWPLELSHQLQGYINALSFLLMFSNCNQE